MQKQIQDILKLRFQEFQGGNVENKLRKENNAL